MTSSTFPSRGFEQREQEIQTVPAQREEVDSHPAFKAATHPVKVTPPRSALVKGGQRIHPYQAIFVRIKAHSTSACVDSLITSYYYWPANDEIYI